MIQNATRSLGLGLFCQLENDRNSTSNCALHPFRIDDCEEVFKVFLTEAEHGIWYVHCEIPLGYLPVKREVPGPGNKSQVAVVNLLSWLSLLAVFCPRILLSTAFVVDLKQNF